MGYAVLAVTVLPFLVYIVVGLRAKAQNIDDYFIYGQRVSVQDYANTSVGYALQMAAIFLFAYWGVIYGLGSLWAPLFWALGFALLRRLLPRFLAFHQKQGSFTLHQYLAETFGAGRGFQSAAAVATVLGLWGTMMSEIDYTLMVYSPYIKEPWQVLFVGSLLLLFGAVYIVHNGYKAEVITERIQVPAAYAGLIVVLLLSLPPVWTHGGRKPYLIISTLLMSTFLLILAAKMVQGWTWRRPLRDPQVLIPILALVGLALMHFWIMRSLPAGSQPTVLDRGLRYQFEAQGFFALFSLLLANVLWMPVDLSTWQRIASVEGQGQELVEALRRGTTRVALESPASWCLGVALGLILNSSGVASEANAPQALSVFASKLVEGEFASYLGAGSRFIYLVLIFACLSVMLSTVDSLISAISFTAYRDLPPYNKGVDLTRARQWTFAILLLGLVIYPVLRVVAGANLPTLLYASYSSQLSLIVVVLLALLGKRLSRRAAILSIAGGFMGTAVSFYLAVKMPENPEFAVLPPIFAVAGAAAGYVLGYRKGDRTSVL